VLILTHPKAYQSVGICLTLDDLDISRGYTGGLQFLREHGLDESPEIGLDFHLRDCST